MAKKESESLDSGKMVQKRISSIDIELMLWRQIKGHIATRGVTISRWVVTAMTAMYESELKEALACANANKTCGECEHYKGEECEISGGDVCDFEDREL